MKKWVTRKEIWITAMITFVLTMAAVTVYAANPINIFVDGEEVSSDVPPQIIDDRVMVPVRWVSEALGADVHWDQENDQVIIHTVIDDDQIVQDKVSNLQAPELDFQLETATEQQLLGYLKEADEWIHDVLMIPEAELQAITQADKDFMQAHLNKGFSQEVIAQYFDRLYDQWENGLYTLKATGLTQFSWWFDTFDVEVSEGSTGKYDVMITAVSISEGMTSTLDATISMQENGPIIEKFRVRHD